MTTQYKLTYFQAMGRAEPSRLLFAAAGKEFTDERISKEDWMKRKAAAPQGQLPVLEINGKDTICQSNAIFRYLAREFDLYGKTSLDAARIDVFLETVRELGEAGMKSHIEPDEAKKAVLRTKCLTEEAPKFLGRLEKLISKDKFAYGQTLTGADLQLYATIEIMQMLDLLKDYPNLKENRQKVEKLDRIAKYIASRPK